jgi:TRAP transporter TAXI family solute receptor
VNKADKASNTVGKAFTVLRCFIDGQEEWGVRELAAVVRQPTSSVHRLLKILRAEGYLEFDSELQRYRVGMEFIRVASIIAKRTKLGPTALPIMRALVEATEESVWLAVYEAERARVVYIEDQAPKAIFPIQGPVGREFPAIGDVAGWAVLAALTSGGQKGAPHSRSAAVKRTQEKGYALDISEGRDPVVKISAPIFGSNGQPIGALVLVMPNHRYDTSSEFKFAASVVDAAAQVSERLGARILGGGSTGSWHDGVQVIAGLLRRYLPGASTEPSQGGGSRNLIDLQQGRGAYCITTVVSARSAYHGKSPFKRPMTELRNVASLSRLTLHIIVRPGIKINNFSDLTRLRVAPGLSGFSSYQLFQELVRMVEPVDGKRRSKDGEIIELDFAEAAQQLARENIDAIFGLIVSETSTFKSVVEARKGRLVALDSDLLEKLLKQTPGYERATIPASTYSNQPRAMNTIAVGTLLATTVSREDNEVAEVARTVFEQRDELIKVSKAYEDLTFEYATRDIGVPFHDGAERYWSSVRQELSDETPARKTIKRTR